MVMPLSASKSRLQITSLQTITRQIQRFEPWVHKFPIQMTIWSLRVMCGTQRLNRPLSSFAIQPFKVSESQSSRPFAAQTEAKEGHHQKKSSPYPSPKGQKALLGQEDAGNGAFLLGEEAPDYSASMVLKRIRVPFCSGTSPEDISTEASLSFPLILTDNRPPW